MTPAELLALADAATPGPWFYDSYAAIYAGDTDPDADVDGELPKIAKVHTGYDGTPREATVADARLIALAPNLARLCAEMGEALEDLSAEGWFASWSDDPRVLTIRAALAKLSELESP